MLEACNFIKETLKHRCFSVIFVKRLGTPILKNIRGGCFYRGINRTSSNISDENFFANSSFLTRFLTIFSKMLRYRYLTGSSIGFRIVLQNNSLTKFREVPRKIPTAKPLAGLTSQILQLS